MKRLAILREVGIVRREVLGIPEEKRREQDPENEYGFDSLFDR